jgi:hypothetical protein
MGREQFEAPGAEVYIREREAISERRKVQTDRGRKSITSQDVDATTIGLALSGGGVRSAAVSLGFLQALDERRALPYVDYVSTVSGGGYAGAYLSSAALNAKNGDVKKPDALMMPISGTGKGAQPAAMMDFIHGGHFLKRTGAFFNRYAIGVLQIWVVVFSALLALSSLIVWVFKQLDYPSVRTFVATLGFEGDIALALFPSFVLFVAWVLAWGVSYFRQQGSAPGVVAQYLFYLLILVTVVAFASLLGTGDISLASPAPTDGRPANQTINSWTRTVQTILIGAIVAALLPYLHPKKLFRSGTAPDSKPVERYVFWFASRALVFGVPFLMISFFAKENISGWNERRDDRFEVVEVSDWNAVHPSTAGKSDSDSKEKAPFAVEWWNEDGSAPNTPAPAVPPSTNADSTQEARVKSLFTRMDDLNQTINALDSPLDDAELEQLSEERSLGSEPLSRWRRWRYLGELVIPAALRSHGDWNKNRFYRIWDARMQLRGVQEDILAELNGNMSTADFYRRFKPDRGWPALREDYKENSDRQAWISRLQQAYDKASEVDARYASANLDETAQARAARLALLADEAADEGTSADAAKSVLLIEDVHRARLAAHRKLMQVYYDGAFQNKSKIFAGVVLDHDQRTRMTWFWWSAGLFLVSASLVSLNATSWHGYYATRLANMWTLPVPGMEREIPLATMNTTRHGYPYHLIGGTLQLMGRQSSPGRYVSRDHFLFSQAKCGSDRLAFCDTGKFMEGELTLADAIAISGGAFTPTQTNNPLIMLLLVLGNLRLGQWVDNPAVCGHKKGRFNRWLWVSPLRMLLHLPQPAERRPFCFVTDGGHHENLGIESLLKRRCRLIIACDACQDEQHSFLDFSKLLTRMRLEQGITIRPIEESEKAVTLNSLVPDKQRYTKDHFLVAEVIYPDESARRSYLVYIKSSLTGDEPTELVQYHRFNPTFPHDPTADQFYSADRFAAYSQLGYHIAEVLCRRLPASLDDVSPAEFIKCIATSPPKPSEPTPSEVLPKTVAGIADSIARLANVVNKLADRPMSDNGALPSSGDGLAKGETDGPVLASGPDNNDRQPVPMPDHVIAQASAQSGTVATELKRKILPKEQDTARSRKKKTNGSSCNNVRRKRPR